MKQAKWYFDFLSPYAYFQQAQFDKLSQHVSIEPKPVVFGALLKHWGQLGPAEIAPKRTFVYRFFQWQAGRIGVPFKMPPAHPFNPLPTLRLCIAADATISATHTIFDHVYGQGLAPDDPDVVAQMARALNIDDHEMAIASQDVKDALRQNTDEAIAAGVFGVPTFVVDDEVFWGVDTSDMMLDYVANPHDFKNAEMQRISNLPSTITRRRN